MSRHDNAESCYLPYGDGLNVPFGGQPHRHGNVGAVVRYRVFVSGRVQGVFFRDACRQIAEEHGVSGWVRNLPDGRVEAVFEGTQDDVQKLVDWTRHGPRRAAVAGVWVRQEQPEGLGTFEVR
jgi:acylphosphatase